MRITPWWLGNFGLVRRSTEPDALSLSIAQALRLNDGHAALKLVDRRLGQEGAGAMASIYILRSAALRLLGESELARLDVAKARELNPRAPSVLAADLSDDAEDVWVSAARALVTMPATPLALRRRALKRLLNVADVEMDLHRWQDWLQGWIYWRLGRPLYVRIEGGGEPVISALIPDRLHPLAEEGNAAWFSLQLRAGEPSQLAFYDEISGGSLAKAGPYGTVPVAASQLQRASGPVATALLVIVPVYDDVEATRQCLESLIAQTDTAFAWRAIIVNDASPNPDIDELISHYNLNFHFEVLSNVENLGFSASVNRAINLRGADEDVLLLNSDAYLPSDALSRLKAAANSSDDIGTVTPLSNNGEQCSFPLKNENNIVRDVSDIERWDAAAASCAGNDVVDMPNGVGFCLYIKAEIVDRLGGLSDDYGRGYYEDVDFCLKARRLGFRNVCAVGIVVGHWGSRSFRADKVALVHRNLNVLEARYPGYKLEFAAYLALDPLAPWRQKILGSLAPASTDVLLMGNASTLGHQLDFRARLLREAGLKVLLLTIEWQGSTSFACFSSHAAPHSELVRYSLKTETVEVENYLRALNLRRVELAIPLSPDDVVGRMLTNLAVPIEILILDAGAAARGLLDQLTRIPVTEANPRYPGANQFTERPGPVDADEVDPRFHALDTVTYQYAAQSARRGRRVMWEAHSDAMRDPDWIGAHPALLMPVWTGPSHDFACAVAGALRERGGPTLLVLGPMVETSPLFRMENVESISYQGEVELEQALRLYQVKAAILPYRTMIPEPEHDILLKCAVPCAFIDFSGRLIGGRRNDRRLLPGSSDIACARTIASWYMRIS